MKKFSMLFTVYAAWFLTSTVLAQDTPFKMIVGDFSVIPVQDDTGEMSASLFKTGDSTVIKTYMPKGKIPSTTNLFVVKSPKNTVLIDAGAGPGTTLAKKLKMLGIAVDDINMVLITHGHFDHVGGLATDGKPTFPNAKIMMAEKERVLYEDSSIARLPQEYQRYYVPANQVLKIYGAKVSTFIPGNTICEGITSFDLKGHTAGQSGFFIESRGQRLLIAGDFLHIAAVQFPHPEYSLVYDSDVDQAAKTRQLLFEKAATEKFPVAGVHIAFPGIGNIRKVGTTFTFDPVNMK